MDKTCANCEQEFTIPQIDLEFYTQIDVPPPTWCMRCRYIRRHGFINDYCFYKRTCDATGKPMISIYPPDSPYTVYSQDAWYSEERDDKAQGREWDPERGFFEQFNELLLETPRLGIIGQNNENCDYCESVANCKSCYLISECSNCEDCSYCYWIQKSQDCYDCNYAHECTRCYEIDNCFNCTRLR